MSEDLNKIVREVQYLIDSQVREKTSEQTKIHEKYLNLKSELESLADEAEFTYENFKAEGLTVNSIEAEGYLRCAKTILNIIALVEGE